VVGGRVFGRGLFSNPCVGVALINSLILINEPQSQIHENAIQR